MILNDGTGMAVERAPTFWLCSIIALYSELWGMEGGRGGSKGKKETKLSVQTLLHELGKISAALYQLYSPFIQGPGCAKGSNPKRQKHDASSGEIDLII